MPLSRFSGALVVFPCFGLLLLALVFLSPMGVDAQAGTASGSSSSAAAATNCFGLRGKAKITCTRQLRLDCKAKHPKDARSFAACLREGTRKPKLATKSASSADLLQRNRPAPRALQSKGATGTTVTPSSSGPKKVGCGDGIVVNEQCDDGNTNANDGCSASCAVETGFACNTSQPSVCWSYCGDGVVATNEKCDDGNQTNGDGCSDTCKVGLGYTCSGSPSVCTEPPLCGNGKVETGEACDDANRSNLDGCNSSCKAEAGYTCAGSPSTCTYSSVCGNGVIEGAETCDDGNAGSSDGCSAACAVEAGYTCLYQPSVCTQ